MATWFAFTSPRPTGLSPNTLGKGAGTPFTCFTLKPASRSSRSSARKVNSRVWVRSRMPALP